MAQTEEVVLPDEVDEACYLPLVSLLRPKDEIVVTGAGQLRPSASDKIQSATIIGDLEPGLGTRIENRLRDEAGIVQFRRSDGRSAHPTSQGVTLRGLGGNASSRALVTLDGVPQADPFGGWVAWSAYDAISLGGIIVARGGGSARAPERTAAACPARAHGGLSNGSAVHVRASAA
ncbi:MAG: Plug domain-containing protein, partial [Sphingopyxis sp.]|nr:Plug domain-containing protein [Sphingopyxis sp.]